MTSRIDKLPYFANRIFLFLAHSNCLIGCKIREFEPYYGEKFLNILPSEERQKSTIFLQTDYCVFFVLGLVWLPIGIATDNPGLWGLGTVFLFVGLANRDKWQGWKKL